MEEFPLTFPITDHYMAIPCPCGGANCQSWMIIQNPYRPIRPMSAAQAKAIAHLLNTYPEFSDQNIIDRIEDLDRFAPGWRDRHHKNRMPMFSPTGSMLADDGLPLFIEDKD